MPGQNSYVPYDDSVEVKQPNEDGIIDQVVASMSRVNRKVFDKHRHATRDAHAKSHGVLKGTLSVYGDLPEAYRQGLFKSAREYPVIVRLSSAPGDLHDDKIRSPKGMAIKVIGVEGAKNPAGPQGHTSQDFLLINFPVIPQGNVAAYLEIQQKLEKHTDDSELMQRLLAEAAGKAASALRLVGGNQTLEAIGAPNYHILGETFHSMAALRYGSYIAKISVTPLSDSVRRLTGTVVETDGDASAFRDRVVEFFKTGSAEYEMRAQLCTDLAKMPVEDGSVEWPEALSPHQPVAKLIFPPQTAYSPERRVYVDDVLSFNPWHCLEEHRPIGSIMRIRIKAYEASSRFRHEMNVQPRVEPQDISEIPD